MASILISPSEGGMAYVSFSLVEGIVASLHVVPSERGVALVSIMPSVKEA